MKDTAVHFLMCIREPMSGIMSSLSSKKFKRNIPGELVDPD